MVRKHDGKPRVGAGYEVDIHRRRASPVAKLYVAEVGRQNTRPNNASDRLEQRTMGSWVYHSAPSDVCIVLETKLRPTLMKAADVVVLGNEYFP